MLTAVLASLSGGAALAEQIKMPVLQPDMPITIDAESSEFDYASSRLLFRGLRLDQGNLGVQADLAVTDKLDFTDGVWVFTGNVVVEAETATLYCEEATIRFVNHELASAELVGSPARFEQVSPGTEKTNSGEAIKITYELKAGLLNLSQKARFSDGANEISGEVITYDLAAGRITAGSGDSGPVKILIEPPTKQPDEQINP